MLSPIAERFIDGSFNLAQFKRDVAAASQPIVADDTQATELIGVVHAPVFLSETTRQAIDGQIFSSGADLRKVYRTSTIGLSNSELIIPNADSQIPILGELRSVIDDLMEYAFEVPVIDHAMQVRVLRPGGAGHPRHIDYADGFTQANDGSVVTPISVSLPIGWNGGRCPAFELYVDGIMYRQTRPGSLFVFGPRTAHATPPTGVLEKEYIWLVIQVFLQYGAVGRELRRATVNLVNAAERLRADPMAHVAAVLTDVGGVMIAFDLNTPISSAASVIDRIRNELSVESAALELVVKGGCVRGSQAEEWSGVESVFSISMSYRIRTERTR